MHVNTPTPLYIDPIDIKVVVSFELCMLKNLGILLLRWMHMTLGSRTRVRHGWQKTWFLSSLHGISLTSNEQHLILCIVR